MAIRIDTANDCSGKDQPGTVCLRDTILRRYPGSRSAGIYNCRDVRGGSSLSIHSEGRAVDINPETTPQGNMMASWLVGVARRYNIQRIIWYRRIWDSNDGWRDYTGANAHTDHLHVEQNWDGAKVCKSGSLMIAGMAWWQYAVIGAVSIGMVTQLIRQRKNRN